MLLIGHHAAIYTMKFNMTGTLISYGSHEREIFFVECTWGLQEFYGFERSEEYNFGSALDN
jgi:hypothetical protein